MPLPNIGALRAVADRLDGLGMAYAFVGGSIVSLLLDDPRLSPCCLTIDSRAEGNTQCFEADFFTDIPGFFRQRRKRPHRFAGRFNRLNLPVDIIVFIIINLGSPRSFALTSTCTGTASIPTSAAEVRVASIAPIVAGTAM
jgi:hypothetical protein